jgi:hypothetical protein
MQSRGYAVGRKLTIIAVLLITWVAVALPRLAASDDGPATRTLQGEIMKPSNAPISGAVVYLKNTRTMAVRSVVSDSNGNYRFSSLSPNVDYEVYAEYKGGKSERKTLSSFDSRRTATINLRIDVE